MVELDAMSTVYLLTLETHDTKQMDAILMHGITKTIMAKANCLERTKIATTRDPALNQLQHKPSMVGHFKNLNLQNQYSITGNIVNT